MTRSPPAILSSLLATCALAFLFAAVATRGRMGTSISMYLQESTEEESASGNVEHFLAVYKRTYVSLDPSRDGKFLQSVLGMSVTTNQVVMDQGENETCAKREVLSTLDNFQLHFFHSYKYPSRLQAEQWLRNWIEDHANMSVTTWDVFASPSVTLYSPWLTPFLHRLEEHDVNHVRYYQVHKIGAVMYSVVLNIPYSGLTLEVISDENLASRDQVDDSTFNPINEHMCPTSLTVHQDLEQLRSTYSLLGGRHTNEHGLPDLLLVSLGFPSTVPGRFSHFVSSVFGRVGIFPKSTSKFDTSCHCWNVQLATTVTINGTAVTSPVYMKAIANQGARPSITGSKLEQFEDDVATSHLKFMATPNEGWDAYVDMHPGLHVNKLLDGIPQTLRQDGYSYTMHPSCMGCAAGSIWATGVTPWAIEMQGAFASSDGREMKTQSLIDYCSNTTNGDTRENIDLLSQGEGSHVE